MVIIDGRRSVVKKLDLLATLGNTWEETLFSDALASLALMNVSDSLTHSVIETADLQSLMFVGYFTICLV